jgi:hypothetical protein
MAQNANNVIVAKPKVTGGVWVAAVGTALPTSETGSLNVAFKTPGYITEDGLKRSEDRDTDNLLAWGGDVIYISQNGVEAQLECAFAEYLNAETQKLIYGDAQVAVTAGTPSAGTKTVITGKLGLLAPKKSWVVEVFSGVATGRLVFPIVQVVETEDVEYKDDELAARGITATLFPDASGNYFYEYWDDGILVP